MTEKRKTIRIEVRDEFSRPLKEYARQMGQAEQSTEKFKRSVSGGGIGGGLRDFNQQLFYASQNLSVITQAFGQVFRTAGEWANLGAAQMRSTMALEALAGSAGEADKWIRALQTGMRGSLTEGEAAAQAYRIMRFELADTAAEAQEFARVISIISAANPQLGGTEEAISQIQLTLSNMSFMRLDQLGLSAGVVRKRMAELKDEIAGLSPEDAFRMAVMEGLTEQANTLGDAITGVTSESDKLAASLRQIKTDIGIKIRIGIEGVATAVNGMPIILDYAGGTAAQQEQLQDALNAALGETAGSIIGTMLMAGGAASAIATGQPWGTGPSEFADVLDVTDPAAFLAWRRTHPLYPQTLIPQNGVGMVLKSGYGASAWMLNTTAPWAGWPNFYTFGPPTAGMHVVPGMVFGQRGAPIHGLPFGMSEYAETMGYGANWAVGGLPSPFAYALRQQTLAGMRAYKGTQAADTWATAHGLEGTGLARYEAQQAALQGFYQSRALEPRGGMLNAALQAIDSGSLDKMAAALERSALATEHWSDASKSLAENLGLAQDVLSADVQDAMSAAMEKANVGTDKQNEALEIYGHLTGAANAASEVFGNKLDWLSQLYASGKIDVYQYLTELQKLQAVDLSGLDWISKAFGQMGASPSNWEYYKGVLDYLSTLDMQGITAAMSAPQTALGMAQTVAGAISGFITGGAAGEGADPASQWATQMAEMDGSTKEFSDKAAGHFQVLQDSGVLAATTIQSAFDSLHINPITTTVTATITSGVGGGARTAVKGGRGGIPEFALGGYTGDGGAGEIAGVVHRGEYVIPRGRMPIVPPFARGGATSQPVQLVLDGRVIYETVIKQQRMAGVA